MTAKEKAVNDYIKAKRNQDECVGFIEGYFQCEKDTADKLTQLKEAIRKHTWYDEDGFPQVNLYAIENYLLD
jgi:hypothetical protein